MKKAGLEFDKYKFHPFAGKPFINNRGTRCGSLFNMVIKDMPGCVIEDEKGNTVLYSDLQHRQWVAAVFCLKMIIIKPNKVIYSSKQFKSIVVKRRKEKAIHAKLSGNKRPPHPNWSKMVKQPDKKRTMY